MRSEIAKQLANFSRYTLEIGHDHLGFSGKSGAQQLVLRRNAHWTRIQVTLPCHYTTHRQQRCGSKTELVRSEERGDHNIAAEFQPAIYAQSYALSKSSLYQRVMGIAQTKFPRKTGVLDRAQW